MAGMKRFITYIYVYENGRKGANTGFAKIEIRGQECYMEIHIRGVSAAEGKGRLFLFLEQNGKMLAFPIGEMKIMNRNGDYGTILKADQIKTSQYTFAQMEGLLFVDDTQQIYMTRWVEGKVIDVTPENIKLWEPPQLDKENSLLQQKEGCREDSLFGQEEKEHEKSLQQERKESREDSLFGQEKEKEIYAMEMPMRNIFPQYSWSDVWKRLKEEYPAFEILGERCAECVRMELKDLRELPRKYWYLGNNSFLLHGFFNYRYFILGKLKKDRWFIGVPGIYQRQEHIMASVFGFPEFLTADERYDCNETKGLEPINYFGYWFHMLDE